MTSKAGVKSFLACIVLKRKGRVIHAEFQTFEREPPAAWIAKRETELRKPGARSREGRPLQARPGH